MPNQKITQASGMLDQGAIWLNGAQQDWDALQAVVLRTGQDFCAGNLGLMYPNLHMLPLMPAEGLFDWYGSFAVGGGHTLTGKHDWLVGGGDQPTEFLIEPDGPYANCYTYAILPSPPKLITRLTDLRVFSMTADWQSKCQALEFETQPKQQRQIHNCAWQCALKEKAWRLFDYNAQSWSAKGFPSIPIPDFTKGPVSVMSEFLLSPGFTQHVALTINGTRYSVGLTQPSTPRAEPDKLTSALQLDGDANGNPTGVSIHAHEVRFSY